MTKRLAILSSILILVVAALGSGDENQETACPNGGVEVPDSSACWFGAELDQSCDDACARNSLVYDEITRTFAGSEGTDEGCLAVLDALEMGQGRVSSQEGDGFGCMLAVNVGRFRDPNPTTSTRHNQGAQRACACKPAG